MRFFVGLVLALALGVMGLSIAGCGGDSNSLSLSDYCLDTYCPSCSYRFAALESEADCLAYCAFFFGDLGDYPSCDSKVLALRQCELENGAGACPTFAESLGGPCCEKVQAIVVCLAFPASPECAN